MRLSKEKELCQLIEETLKTSLVQHNLVPGIMSTKGNSYEKEELKWEKPSLEKKTQELYLQPKALHSNLNESKNSSYTEQTKTEMPDMNTVLSEVKDAFILESKDSSELDEKKRLPDMTPLCQVHGTYIVAESKDGLYLLDQHAAHERIFYEEIYNKMGSPSHFQQPLLVPLTIECTTAKWQI